jgi:hypothetical protein
MNFTIRNLTHCVSGTGLVPVFGLCTLLVHNNLFHFDETDENEISEYNVISTAVRKVTLKVFIVFQFLIFRLPNYSF